MLVMKCDLIFMFWPPFRPLAYFRLTPIVPIIRRVCSRREYRSGEVKLLEFFFLVLTQLSAFTMPFRTVA